MPTLNIICFVEKNIFQVLFAHFGVTLLKVIVLSRFLKKMLKYLKIYLTIFTIFLEISGKKL